MAKIEYPKAVIIPAFFIIPNVKRNDGEFYTAKVMQDLTKPLNLNGIKEEYARAKTAGEPAPISMDDWYSIMNSATKGITKPEQLKGVKAQFMNFNKKILRNKLPNFYTSILWSPLMGEDKIIHYGDSSEEYSFKGEFIGNDSWIESIDNGSILKPLTGISRVSLLNKISDLSNGTKTFNWRFNSKPNSKTERVARLDAFSGGLNLDASRNPLYQYPAFRVEWIKE